MRSRCRRAGERPLRAALLALDQSGSSMASLAPQAAMKAWVTSQVGQSRPAAASARTLAE